MRPANAKIWNVLRLKSYFVPDTGSIRVQDLSLATGSFPAQLKSRNSTNKRKQSAQNTNPIGLREREKSKRVL